MRIIIETIPHSQQRYDTCGDYWTMADGSKRIVVSDMKNEDYAFLVGIHELVEMYLTERRGIKEPDITSFDVSFEKQRARKERGEFDEPGDAPDAPYQNEHNFATGIERLVAAALGVKWADYDNAVVKLP